MQTTISDKGVLTKEFKITFSKEEVNQKYQEKLKEIAPQVEMPGYRKGKVSPRIVEMKYKNTILEEVQKDLARAGIDHINKDFKTYGDFEFPHFGEVKLNSEFSYQLVTSLFPDIELPEYKGLKIDGETPTVSAEELDKAVQNFMTQVADEQEIADDSKCEAQDMVNFSYTVKVDQQVVKTEANKFSAATPLHIAGIKLDESALNALIGTKKGEMIQCKATLENNFEPNEFQGKPAEISITIVSIKRKAAAALDDAFATKFGMPSASKMKEFISDRILHEKKQAALNSNREKLLEAICSKVSFEIPEKLLKATLKNLAHEHDHADHDHVHDENCNHDHNHEHVHDENCNHDHHHHEEHVHGENCDHSHDHEHDHADHDHATTPASEESTKDRLKKQIILEMIAQKESITVTENDFSQYIHKLAAMYKMPAKDLANRITESMAMDISREIKLTKALDVITTNAITDVAK